LKIFRIRSGAERGGSFAQLIGTNSRGAKCPAFG
jgi:hypothetical protein